MIKSRMPIKRAGVPEIDVIVEVPSRRVAHDIAIGRFHEHRLIPEFLGHGDEAE
jgi:hypothetical protein